MPAMRRLGNDDQGVPECRRIPAGARGSTPNCCAGARRADSRIASEGRDRASALGLFHDENPPWLLKGGYAMELRFGPKARTTRDVDLTIGETVAPEMLTDRLVVVHEALDIAAKRDLGDFFEFTIPPARSELRAAP